MPSRILTTAMLTLFSLAACLPVKPTARDRRSAVHTSTQPGANPAAADAQAVAPAATTGDPTTPLTPADATTTSTPQSLAPNTSSTSADSSTTGTNNTPVPDGTNGAVPPTPGVPGSNTVPATPQPTPVASPLVAPTMAAGSIHTVAGDGASLVAGAGGGGGGGLGGAIFNHGGTFNLQSCVFTNNKAHGGPGGWPGGLGGQAYGGAIFNLNGTVALTSATFSANTVVAGHDAGGAIVGWTGGPAVYNLSHQGGNLTTGAVPAARVTTADTALVAPDIVNGQVDGTATVTAL